MPRVLITRAPHQASALADALRAVGCEPVLIPTIDLAPPASFTALDEALAGIESFHWLIFTSANAVEAFASRVEVLQGMGSSSSINQHEVSEPSAPERPTQSIAAIGPATARALQDHGLRADLIPPQAIAESLTDALLPHARRPDGTPTRFLLIRAESARDILPETLRAAGADLTIAPAYRTIIPASSIVALQQLFHGPTRYPDAITFTSSSTATNLFALLEAANLALPAEIIRASIGPVTSRTLRAAGLPPHIEASEATVTSLAQAVAAALCDR